MHEFEKKTKVLRTDKTGSRHKVPCPQAIADYNSYMGGVDHFDQLHATYTVTWKSQRWWMKIFFYLLDAAIANSYRLYKEDMKKKNPNQKPMNQLQFRSSLANALISTYSCRKRPGPQKN
ncbi:Transposase IS4 [Popillia japonica]|uniref:Transposase IS4 n=1 Tax=Popillia japonica TaxID=7064 RepID=A0AAW1L3Q7_POPJA